VLAEMKRDAEALAELDGLATDNIQTLTLRAKLRYAAVAPGRLNAAAAV
jgi:hypothetical protein